jgi:arylsulfatase A-like enzyme
MTDGTSLAADAPDRRRFLSATGAAMTLAAAGSATAGQVTASPPNILFILADDLGYADLSALGRRDYVTPVLDRLAAEGLTFTQAYANSPVCSPTRVALMTGRYQQRLRVGLEEPIRIPDRVSGLPTDIATLPSVLRAGGYRTALVGKWHLGWPPDHGPLQCGYDRFFGIVPAGANYFLHTANGPGQAPDNALFEGDSPTAAPGYLTDLLAARAIVEINDSLRRGQPFLVSLHFTAPHWPWQGPGDAGAADEIADVHHGDGGSLETFAEMVRAMDIAVGRVLEELERNGAARNTLVVFTSDNGGERFSDTWPLRGGKRELLEGGVRTPLLTRWPGRIAAGARTEQVMTTMDWLPTLAAAAGVPLPSGFEPDGENLLDVLLGREAPRARTVFWRFDAGEQAAVRQGDWKYLKMGPQEWLFDLARDPRERANRRQAEPVVFERLKAEWAAWNATMLAPPSAACS